MDLLNVRQYYGHEVSYIIQSGTQLFSKNDAAIPLRDPHGVRVAASAGAATFGDALVIDAHQTPELMAVVDGNKSGLDWVELEAHIQTYVANSRVEPILALVRRLSHAEIQAESRRRRRRYARVTHLETDGDLLRVTRSTQVLDPRTAADASLLASRDTLAFCGIYVVRTREFVRLVDSGRGSRPIPTTEAWSFNSLHAGQARALRMSMCLWGSGVLDIPFVAIMVSHPLPGIKEDKDVTEYQNSQSDYAYRQRLPGWGG